MKTNQNKMGKNNKTTLVASGVYTNRHTGANIRMAPAGTLGGDPAWLVKDKELVKYAADNYSRGYRNGWLGACVLVGSTVLAITTIKILRRIREEEKEKREK
jgi:hypothetical protein